MQKVETQFPELSLVESLEEKSRILHVAKQRVKRGVRYWLYCLIDMAVMFAILIGSLRVINATVNVPSWCSQGIAGIVGFVYLSTSFVVLFRRAIRKELRKELLERGMPVCLGCGYHLCGQVEPRCPECGSEFDATLLRNDREESGTKGNSKSVAPKGEDNGS